ncbi:MAG: hypothetical protein CEN92_349 [Candidatus Berkelbacteria bacterium Licking1014_96]|uniref:NYN domain-containing protein n=1 Tax=Candidatus Berkelbacteria bacterium Licking1014_96 TaxID=2017149 RepID=A0A554LE80_9BACT|nr:MAG: hypothetical protein CEN92_349 [Candidatus Berkelbacteria bacterium Licking1014_96]
MKKKNQTNHAFIDGQNLNLGIKDQGWKLDLKKFRVYLKDKFNVTTAYYFIGYIEGNSSLYKSLQEYGYLLIFKPTFQDRDGEVKGNCDAELVLQAMIDYKKYDKAIIVSGDGDFGCLVSYLIKKNKLETVIAPDNKKCSWLLRKATKNKHIMFLNGLKNKLEYKKKVP